MALLFAFSFGTKMLFYFLAPRCFPKMQLFHIMVTSYCSLHFLLALFQDAILPSPLFTPNTAGRCWRYLWTRSESWLRTFLSLSLSSKIPYQPYRPIYFQFEVNWLFFSYHPALEEVLLNGDDLLAADVKAGAPCKTLLWSGGAILIPEPKQHFRLFIFKNTLFWKPISQNRGNQYNWSGLRWRTSLCWDQKFLPGTFVFIEKESKQKWPRAPF